MYFSLLHEQRFNAPLARATPPGKDEGLPEKGEWVRGGGLKEVREGEEEGKEECVVCRGEREDPVRIAECGHVFCRGCVWAWWGSGHRT